MTSILIDRTDGLSSAAAIKGPCKVATTANITLYGEQTIDGVAVVTGDRVLVKDQTAGYENGIYICDTGQWRRSKDFNRTNDVVKGTMVFVNSGTISAETMWAVTSDNPVVVGTDTITFSNDVLIPPDDSVGTGQLVDGAVTEPKLAADLIIRNASTRTALKAIDTTRTSLVYLKETGREGLFKWTAGDYSTQITADTAEGIYVKADAIASTSGAWVRQYDGAPVVNWWGAIPDYSVGGSGTDSTAAIQCAVTVCNLIGEDELVFKPSNGKKYLVTDTITGKTLVLKGIPGAGIVFKNMTGLDGFSFTGATEEGKTIGATDLELIAEGANIASAIKGPKQADQYLTYRLRYKFERNFCRGANRDLAKYGFASDYSAGNWFLIGDSIGGTCIFNHVHGAFDIKTDPSTQFQDCPLKTDCASATFPIIVFGNDFFGTYRASELGERSFVEYISNTCSGNYDGLVWSIGSANLYNEPKVVNNRFNSQRYGIYVDGSNNDPSPNGTIGSLLFDGNTVRRHHLGWAAATNDWFGFYLKNVTEFHLSGNHVQPDHTTTSFAGTEYAYYLSGCGIGGGENNNVGANCDRGFLLDNCTGVTLRNTLTMQADAADVLFRLINNTRRSDLGNVVYVSSFAGTKLSDDGTIGYSSVNVDELMGLDRVPVGTTLTLSSNTAGAVTATGSYHLIDTNGGAASGELATITPSAWITVGTRLTIRSTSSVRDVTVKDGTGNIQCAGDFVLSHVQDYMVLMYTAGSVWQEVSRSDNAA